MIRTEAEAHESRCCGPEGCGIQASASDLRRYCLGKRRCQGWREVGVERGGALDSAIHRLGLTVEPVQTTGEPRGYCGLAGKP